MNKLIWVDCEMTGLNVDKDQLLEIALIITDIDLNEIDQMNPIQIKASENTLNLMSDWCKKHFYNNGLAQECLASDITIEKTDFILNEFMIKNNIKNGILVGNSISTDRQFLDKYCPKFISHLHYRMVDVSSIKLLVNLWHNDRNFWNKNTSHRALNDIYQSIEELKYYKEKYFTKL